MSDNYKILGQAEVLPGISTPDFGVEYQDTLIYQVPEDKQAAISGMTITNYADVEKQYSVAFVNEDDSDKDQFGLKTVLVYGPEISTIGLVNTNYIDGGYIVTTQSIDGIGYEASNLQTGGNTIFLTKYVNNLWFHTAGGNKNNVSSDGLNWVKMSSDAPGGYLEIYDVVYAQNQYVAVGWCYGGNIFLTSADGVNWTVNFTSNNYRSLATDGTTVVAATSYQTFYIAYTTDLVTWNQQYIDGYSYDGRMYYIDGYFLYQNTWSFTLQYSTSGYSWGAIYSPHNQKNGFFKLNDKIYFAGYQSDAWVLNLVSMNVYYETSFQNVFGTPFYIYGIGKISNYNGVSYVLANTQELWKNMTIDKYSVSYVTNKFLNRYGSYDWNMSVDFGPVTTFSKTITQVYTSLKKHKAVSNKSIFPGETHEIKGGIVLSEGDQVRIYSEDGQISSSLFGVEIDIPNSQQSSHTGGN